MEQVTNKRQAILDATLRLISQNGFHGTSMSQVAEEAKVSTGIIYHYFESKDELIDELYKSINRKSAQAILKELDQEQPVKTQIQQLLRNIIRYFVWHPQESVFTEQYIRSPYHHTDIEIEVSEYYQPAIACYERARQERIIKDLPQCLINILTVNVATSLAQRQARGQIKLTEEFIEQVNETSWDAIRQ
jgi:AcrR family transcriptional regulator